MITKSYYEAIVGGRAYRATRTQDPAVVNLRWTGPGVPDSGFVRSPAGSYKKSVRLDELDSLSLVEWRCEYRGEPFVVNGEDGGMLFVSYVGDSETRARELGMNVVERFVADGEIPKSEVENLREVRKQYWPAPEQK
ncbi:hypothetical protein [Kutzneria sp. NPDC052558]|uniref:hypothetical protein n=1 Tax=Kutzneria sp. NPDC052558 TaxID=3364121 RepID=UPI0037CA6254